MNKEQFQGQWNEIKGKIKEKWGKLTDQDLTRIDGKREQLLGELQKKYGLAKEKAEEQLRNFEESLSKFAHEHRNEIHAGASRPSNPNPQRKENLSRNERTENRGDRGDRSDRNRR